MPVLLPLYVATYEDERHDSGNFLTMFIQAHSNEVLLVGLSSSNADNF